MNKEKILGFNISNIKFDELINLIFNDFNNNISNFIVNINPEIIMNYYKNEEMINIFNKENYQIPDGIGIVYASKIKKGNIKDRITGIDLMEKLCEKSINYNSKIFLYGGKENIAEKAKTELEKKYSGINIVGTCNGYIDDNTVIDNINKSNANILFVGTGSPKQEEFIINNRNKLKNVKIFMPVGGSFDVISKTLKRAPDWTIKCHIEWLYRALRQPKRFFRIFKLFRFIFLVLISKDNGGIKSGKN